MTKILAIYFSEPREMDYPFHKSEYLEIYQGLIDRLSKHNIHSVIVRGNSYQGNGVFSHGWKFGADNKLEKVETVQADLIFNRDDKNTIPFITDCPIINRADFDDLCLDKVKTFKFLPQFSPKSETIHTFEAYLKTVQDWDFPPEERIVLKKNFEAEGRGIVIKPWKDIVESDYDDWSDLLVQEFIDSSGGIPEIIDGYHDLRVTVIEGTPINSFVRTPKTGSLLANVSQGGSGLAIPIDKVPKDVLDFVSEIHAQLEPFEPNIYAADFMLGQRGWKLIELNSRPGVQHPNWSSTYETFNTAVIEMLVKHIKN